MKIRKDDMEYQIAEYYNRKTHRYELIEGVASHGTIDYDKIEYFSKSHKVPMSDIVIYDKTVKFHDNDKVIIQYERIYDDGILSKIPIIGNFIGRRRTEVHTSLIELTDDQKMCIALLMTRANHNLNEAISIVTNACPRCINSLLYEYSDGHYGYREFSAMWFSAHTMCVFCEDSIPMMAYRNFPEEDMIAMRIYNVKPAESQCDSGETFYLTTTPTGIPEIPTNRVIVNFDTWHTSVDKCIIFDGNDKLGGENFTTKGPLMISRSWLSAYPRAVSRPFDIKAIRKEYYDDEGNLHDNHTWCDVGNYIADSDMVSLWNGDVVEHVPYESIDAIVPFYKN